MFDRFSEEAVKKVNNGVLISQSMRNSQDHQFLLVNFELGW